LGNERWRVVAPLRAVNDQKGIVEISRGAVLEAIASPGDVGFVRVQWNTQECWCLCKTSLTAAFVLEAAWQTRFAEPNSSPTFLPLDHVLTSDEDLFHFEVTV
jgi:hypothetical protein